MTTQKTGKGSKKSGVKEAPVDSVKTTRVRTKRARRPLRLGRDFLKAGTLPKPKWWVCMADPHILHSITSSYTGEGFPGALAICEPEVGDQHEDEVQIHRWAEVWVAMCLVFGDGHAVDILQEFMNDVFRLGSVTAYEMLDVDPDFKKNLRKFAKQRMTQARKERPKDAPPWRGKKRLVEGGTPHGFLWGVFALSKKFYTCRNLDTTNFLSRASRNQPAWGPDSLPRSVM